MSPLLFAQGNSVPFYLGQLALAHALFHRPTMITEANLAYGRRHRLGRARGCYSGVAPGVDRRTESLTDERARSAGISTRSGEMQ